MTPDLLDWTCRVAQLLLSQLHLHTSLGTWSLMQNSPDLRGRTSIPALASLMLSLVERTAWHCPLCLSLWLRPVSQILSVNTFLCWILRWTQQMQMTVVHEV